MEIANLNEAYSGSYFTILGAGGPAEEWVNGVNGMLEDEGVGTPVKWFRTSGAAVNSFAGEGIRDPFPNDLTILMFPLDGLDVGRLSILRLSMPDFKWFDDVVDNMR